MKEGGGSGIEGLRVEGFGDVYDLEESMASANQESRLQN